MNQGLQTLEEHIWEYFETHGRHDLPWRNSDTDGSFNAYYIMVSEIMLQQTQVARVIAKYHEFLALFPTVASLAQAPLADVLKAWSGLGYNRRAKFLWQAAGMLHADYADTFPQTVDELVALPGIGVNTAGAIAAYAFDRPVIFIETNIRTVFIHHFFADTDDVHDKQLAPLLQQAMDDILAAQYPGRTPRTWYWALMDYGTHLKQTVGNASRRSKTYAKQSTFQGSKRQIRGQILRLLGAHEYSLAALRLEITDERLDQVLADLLQEEFISYKHKSYHLSRSVIQF
ncbi:MAG: A/G-specific adenine glycosylase [Candidatus Saccharibacteria bacterium]